MTIHTLIINPKDVLFQQSEQQPHLVAFLNAMGMEPRHPRVIEKGIRAARFDVLLGRISRDVYYDALLKLHGVPEHANMRAGREALLADSLLLTANYSAIPVLQQLYVAGIQLSLIMNSEHSADEMVSVLNHFGFVHTLWHDVIASSEIGHIIPDPAMFEAVIHQPNGIVYLSPHAVPWLIEQGIINLVYGDDDSVPDAFNVYNLEQLIDLLIA